MLTSLVNQNKANMNACNQCLLWQAGMQPGMQAPDPDVALENALESYETPPRAAAAPSPRAATGEKLRDMLKRAGGTPRLGASKI